MLKNKYRQAAAWILAAVMMIAPMAVSAAEINNGAVYSITTNEMENWPQGPDVYGETAVLMDAETGAVLYDKGMNEKRYPASITKILTALVAVENSDFEDVVTFTETCLADQVAGSGNFKMQVGEQLSMKDCLMILILYSANDVATQIAEYIGGSVAGFADMMNTKAQQIGCMNTHFVNASGMPDPDHYTTAYDMALIFREAIKNDKFMEVAGTVSYLVPPTNMTPESRELYTHHPLLSPGANEYYEGCIGGKTGVTDEARHTLVSGAQREGRTLIAVSLRAELGELCADHISLFDYGFQNFDNQKLEEGSVVLPDGWSLDQYSQVVTEVEEGTKKEYYYQNDWYMGSNIEVSESHAEPETDLTQENEEIQNDHPEEVQTEDIESARKDQLAKEAAEHKLHTVLKVIVVVMAVAVAALIVVMIVKIVRKNSKQTKR